MKETEQSFIGQCPELARTLHAAQLVAMTDVPVMILGESGCGRTRLAKLVHSISGRRDQGIAVISCVGIDSLSPIFEVGEKVSGGTLVISDLDALDLSLQAGLLSFVENESLRIIVTASDKIAEMVRQGQFREDLYFRLNVVPVELPSLRHRSGDIPLLLKYFSRRYASLYKRQVPEYSTGARQVLKSYPWPGNIRELRNFCERMVILLPGRMIELGNLSEEMVLASRPKSRNSIFTLPETGINLEQVEQDLIRQAIETSSGNRSKAARLLGISRDTLNYRVKKYAL